MNLKLGEIELNGILLKKDTSIDEVINNPQFVNYGNLNSKIVIFHIKNTNIEGYIFLVKVFFLDKKLYKIQMIPICLEMKDPGYPDKKYQAEKKKVADNFLRKKLGVPLEENKAVLYYEFNWGNICSIAFLRGRNEYTGGFIEIIYK